MRLLYKFDIFLGPRYQKPVDPIVEEGRVTTWQIRSPA